MGGDFDGDPVNLLFPSPCGEKVGIKGIPEALGRADRRGVSVPLRGKGRDQRDGAEPVCGCRGEGFRPLAGKR